MSPRFAHADSWFAQHGYERTSTQLVRYSTKHAGIVFDLAFKIYLAIDKPESQDYISWITYRARIPALSDLHAKLVKNSSFSSIILGEQYGLFAQGDGFRWYDDYIILEKTTIGPRWQKILTELEHDLPLAWSALADADDICDAVDASPYWRWWFDESRGRLFVLLYQQQWDKALEYVRSWTEKNINPKGMSEMPGRWTVQQELDNAIAVVTDYANQHR